MEARRLISLILSLIFLILFSSTIVAQEKLLIGQHSYTFEGTNLQLDYLLFLPESYNENKEKIWPLIIYFHGSGMNQSLTESIRFEGLPKKVEAEPNFPFIVLAPHFKNELGNAILEITVPLSRGENLVDMRPIKPILETTMDLIDEVMAMCRIDASRIYATGMSQGGYVTWFMASEYPDRFAAIAPMGGGGNPESGCNLKPIPVWAFHGANDEVVPISEAEEMVDAVNACGGNAQLTVHPDAGHAIIITNYDDYDPDLYTWLRQYVVVNGVHTSVNLHNKLLATWGTIKH